MRRKGTVLLVVLFIVMVSTIISLSFLSRCDIELACGQNMLIRTQMDYLAESGLEHARGLILNPQDIPSEYWSGIEHQQLVSGLGDYYDIDILKLQERNYQIDCTAFRLRNEQITARSSLEAQLWLYPCIGLWTSSNTSLLGDVLINGDIYCEGNFFSSGLVNGDAFVAVLNASITGKRRAISDISLNWPSIEINDYVARYPLVMIDANSVADTWFGPYEPVRVCYHEGDLSLDDSVVVNGLLVVNGSLTINGIDNALVFEKNLPALFVAGNVTIQAGGELDVTGLMVVQGSIQVDGQLNVIGSLFSQADIVGTGSLNISASGSKASIITWPGGIEIENWSPAAGAVFRNIVRK